MAPVDVSGSRVAWLPGLPVECLVLEPTRTPCAGTVVHVHGGGWVSGSPGLLEGTLRLMVAAGGFRVVSVAYRLAPEFPFPAGLHDVVAGVRRVLAQTTLGPTALLGESAGANLVIAAARRVRGEAHEPVALALVNPALDPTLRFPSASRLAAGYGLSRAKMEWFWRQYLATPSDATDPDAAPLLADLRCLPPTLVLTAGWDLLQDEGTALAERLFDSGVEVDSDHRPTLLHNHVWTTGAVDAAGAAAVDVARWLRDRLSRSSALMPRP